MITWQLMYTYVLRMTDKCVLRPSILQQMLNPPTIRVLYLTGICHRDSTLSSHSHQMSAVQHATYGTL